MSMVSCHSESSILPSLCTSLFVALSWTLCCHPLLSPLQCGKLESLQAFDGHKRSCRVQLARRRAASFRLASTSSQTAQQDTSGPSALLRPVRGGVRKAVSQSSLEVMVLRAQQQREQAHQQAEVCSRLLSIHQQLQELEQHVDLIGSQQEAKAQLQHLQLQYQQLLLESAQQQQLPAAHIPAPAAMGHYGVGMSAGTMLLGRTPPCVPMVLTPAGPAPLPLVLPTHHTASVLTAQAAMARLPLQAAAAAAQGLRPAVVLPQAGRTTPIMLGPPVACHMVSSSSSMSSDADSRSQSEAGNQSQGISLRAPDTAAGNTAAGAGAFFAASAAAAGAQAGAQTGPVSGMQPSLLAMPDQQGSLTLPDGCDSLMFDDMTDFQELLGSSEAELNTLPCSNSSTGSHGPAVMDLEPASRGLTGADSWLWSPELLQQPAQLPPAAQAVNGGAAALTGTAPTAHSTEHQRQMPPPYQQQCSTDEADFDGQQSLQKRLHLLGVGLGRVSCEITEWECWKPAYQSVGTCAAHIVSLNQTHHQTAAPEWLVPPVLSPESNVALQIITFNGIRASGTGP